MQKALETKNIVKKYGNKEVLKNINMTIYKGDIYGFIGKNGAGKTTFMRVVLSLTNKDEGQVNFFDNKSINEVGKKIGSLIESPGLYKNSTAYENMKRFSILLGADQNKIGELLSLVGLSNVGNKKVKDFSLGMKQRLSIAIVLLNEPEFLMLDEPINGLDPEGIKEIRDLILKLNKEKNITFLISSHLLDELSKVVTRYGIIDKGVLIEEVEAKELKERCTNKLIIEVDNVQKASGILSKIVDEKDIKINKSIIEINSHINESAIINKGLIEKGVMVKQLYTKRQSLEEYFMEKVSELRW